MSINPDDLGLEPPHPTFEDVLAAGHPGSRTKPLIIDMGNEIKPYVLDEAMYASTAIAAALRAANGERSDVYGDPREHWTATGRGWAALIARRLGIACPDLPADLVALMFDFDKSVRLCETPGHFDSHVDKHGYTHLHERVV